MKLKAWLPEAVALEVLVPFKMEEEPYKLGETGKPLHRVGPAYVFFFFFF